jgi:phosphoglycolate phosphatase
MIDGVIFDKDGTLFDFRKSWGAWSVRLLDSLARDEAHSEQMAEAIGYDRATQDFLPHSPVIAATAVEIAAELMPFLPDFSHQDIVGRMNDMAHSAQMEQVIPLRPALLALRDIGLRIGLATNDTEAPAKAHLAAHDIVDMFDFVAGCDSGHGAKPAPGMLLAFAKQAGLTPARVVMVGDSRHDLMAGRAAGMQTVAVLTGIATADELAPHADAVLPDIGGLQAWILSRRAT